MKIDSGDTAWLLASSALVLFMTPGLAFFYGGMVRSKNVLAMLMQNFLCIGLVSVVWAVVSYSLAFGADIGGHGLLGGLHFAGLAHQGDVVPGFVDDKGGTTLTIPPLVFVAFQMMFAIITPALITGAIADRVKFGGFVAFIALWSIVVYAPVAHWVFSPTGWLNKLGALDFAGGTVVHANAGAAALAVVLVIGKRRGWPREQMKPHSLPLTLLGAGILWFGWFGFNAGSALGANASAAQAFMSTQLATAAGLLAWIGVEKLRNGHATTLGAASGAVAGLVAITPACGSVSSMGSIIVGLVAGGACAFAVSFKYKFGYDDSLDVVGVHLVGGILGALIIGLLADPAVAGDKHKGLFYGGGLSQLGHQALAVLAVVAYSFIVSYLLAKLVDVTIGLRVSEDDEIEGLDSTSHAETAYDFGTGLASAFGGGDRSRALAAQTPGRVDA
ncbi:MAG: ammonium transporter [Actinomycetota bacterium]|nr:ammonium transporter [Actinomycetota bacterium]